MFVKDVALYLAKIYPGVEITDQEERRILVLEWLIQPFNAEMAMELGIMGQLFTRAGAAPIDDLLNITMAIKVPLQQVEFRMAPDQPDASVILRAVEIEPSLKVRRDKEGPVYAATLVMSVRYPAPDDLLFLMNGYRRQHFLTCTKEQGDMLEQAETGKKKKGRQPRELVEEPYLPPSDSPATT